MSALGAFFCCVVIYLTLKNAKNRALRAYAFMMVGNAIVDLILAINTLMTLPTACFGPQVVFMLVDNPIFPTAPGWTTFAVGTHLFFMFLGVAMLPLQFVYRYGVMRGQPFTPWQLLAMFSVSLMMGGIHGGLCPFTFSWPSPEWDAVLHQSMGDPNQELPGYLAGDIHEFGIMAMHFCNVFVIMSFSYTVIILMIYLSKQTVTLAKNDKITKQTQAVQKQVTRIIYFQAFYPVFVVGMPCVLFTIFVVQGKQVPYIGEWAVSTMHTPPLFNSLSVILCVPSYRKFVVHPFKTTRSDSSSSRIRSLI
ncbi:unnamed protein product [Bursaphelenchus okinawaensis]|uniref:G protein-coupled receptor n=1 Tax=Bursaphelenchus okinawaensis TaxID=465554 RepID=A0A811L841_9BILA|nr:unnamed protein product [Bursaphelenchus okinawaensis]CAG9117953.1 unnamed protein product [Bursaphelenchus okinawaensis]